MTDGEGRFLLAQNIKTGLEECLSHGKGELTLATVRVPAPPTKKDAKKIASLRRKLRMSQKVLTQRRQAAKNDKNTGAAEPFSFFLSSSCPS